MRHTMLVLTAACTLTLTGCANEIAGVAVPDPGQAGVALTDDEFKTKLEGSGFDPLFAGGLAETRRQFEAERARWLPIAEAAGTKIN